MTTPAVMANALDDTPVRVASPQPIYGRPLDIEPLFHPFIERLYKRLPQVYRIMDARQDWTLKRFLAGWCTESAALDDILTALWGARPKGPVRQTPSPLGMSATELQRWYDDRQARPSGLGDPYTARAAWLPWLAQHIGVMLDPAATEQEHRDAIRYGTSGWHAGTESSIAYAARSALTGTRYSRLIRGWRPDTRTTGLAPTMWDLTVITRTSETPDPAAVLATIARKGAKPAGAVLHHAAYEAPWDVIEALRPTWTDWERTRSADNTFHATTWTELEETGLSFSDVPGQKWRNASFESGVTYWSAVGGSIEAIAGGIDAFGAARLTAAGTVSAAYARTNLAPGAALETSDDASHYSIRRVRAGLPAVLAPDVEHTITPWQGSNYGRFVLTGDASSGPTVYDAGLQCEPVAVTAGTSYTFGVHANSSGGQTGYAHIGVEWLDSNGTVLSTGGVVNGSTAASTQLSTADSWTALSLVATAPTGATQARMIIWWASAEARVARTMRFDGVQIERSATYDGTFIVGAVTVPAQTPGIDVSQAAVSATYHEDYRAALNIQPIDGTVSVRVRLDFYNDSGALLDTQITALGTFAPQPWRRTPTATFRTNAFATSMIATLQFRGMLNGQRVDIDATELRAFTGGV